MGCRKLTYEHFASVEAQPKSAHRRNPTGNRITSHKGTETRSYTTNNLNQYTDITSGGTSLSSPSYDDDGNMTATTLSSGTWTYTWNAENRLTEAETNVGASPRWRITFFYDNMGRRVEKKTYTGTVRAHYEYSPFGKITAMTGDKAADNPFRFSSEYHDDETALVYYNYRYYSPELGRWTKRDPVEGDHEYRFISNNVFSKYDHNGLLEIEYDWGNELETHPWHWGRINSDGLARMQAGGSLLGIIDGVECDCIQDDCPPSCFKVYCKVTLYHEIFISLKHFDSTQQVIDGINVVQDNLIFEFDLHVGGVLGDDWMYG